MNRLACGHRRTSAVPLCELGRIGLYLKTASPASHYQPQLRSCRIPKRYRGPGSDFHWPERAGGRARLRRARKLFGIGLVSISIELGGSRDRAADQIACRKPAAVGHAVWARWSAGAQGRPRRGKDGDCRVAQGQTGGQLAHPIPRVPPLGKSSILGALRENSGFRLAPSGFPRRVTVALAWRGVRYWGDCAPSWRAEFGPEIHWSRELGRAVMAAGAGALWPTITAG